MPSTLSLSCSWKIYGLLGDTYLTQARWQLPEECPPAPSFSETIRLLPRIAEKKGWSENGLWGSADDIAQMYMLSDTEEEGMEQVSNYLEALL